MSPPEAEASGRLHAKEALALDESQLVEFLDDHRTSRGKVNISIIDGVDTLPADQRDELKEKLRAAKARAGPVNITRLTRLLAKVAETGAAPKTTTKVLIYPTDTRWAWRPDPNVFEASCYDELVETGGRPLLPIERLRSLVASADRQDVPGPWLGAGPPSDNPPSDNQRPGDLPQIFSTQLEDWHTFRQRWQWDNRGRIACEEGLAAFLESEKKDHLRQGRVDWVNSPSFEPEAKYRWTFSPPRFERSRKEGFAAYAQAVARRLAVHNFTQPFQLAEDPREQDPRTTWIEYLNYVYWDLDRRAALIARASLRFCEAWDKLYRVWDTSTAADRRPQEEAEEPRDRATRFLCKAWNGEYSAAGSSTAAESAAASSTPVESTAAVEAASPNAPAPPDEEVTLASLFWENQQLLEERCAAQNQVRELNNAMDTFISATQSFRRASMGLGQRQRQARWILDELPLVEATSSPGEKKSSSPKAGTKRTLSDGPDTGDDPQPKKTRQDVDESDSVLSPAAPGEAKGANVGGSP